MPSGPKKRRAARHRNVMRPVKIEEGLEVKIEPVPVEVVAVKTEPAHFEEHDPVVDLPKVGHVEPALVGVTERVSDFLGPEVVVEPVDESSVHISGVAESSMVVEPSVTVACSADSREGIIVVGSGNGDESSRNECDQVDQPVVEVEVHNIDGEGLSSVNELASSREAIAVMAEDNGLVQKCLTACEVKVQFGEAKRAIEDQLRVLELVTINLRQILATLD